jgi:hypothetical protein
MHPLASVAGLVGAVVGFYCGLMLLIPFGGAAIILFLGKRFASARLKPFVAAVSVIFGHGAWMLAGALLTHTGMGLVIPDVAVIVIGLLWLIIWPGLGPVILLSIYEIFSLVVNVTMILKVEFGTVSHKALTAHIALRLFALAALIAGYWQFRQNQKVKSVEIPTYAP